jgi:protein ImuB
MLWACLHFSDLPLRALFDSSELAQPCALTDGPRNRQRIVYANTLAQSRGARLDQPPAAARAMCANLAVRNRDRAAEQRLLRSLAAWAYRFSSHVSLSEPDALLIEVGASLRLFGGWLALEQRLRHELAQIEHAPAIAVAPLPAAARVLAAHHDGCFIAHQEPMLATLAQVPIVDSGLSADAITLLYRVGLRTLGEVFALPRAEFARRAGPQTLDALDRLRGNEPDILPLYQPPDRFEHRIELDDRVEAWPPLLFPLRRLCGELALFLAARDGGVQRCELVLDHEGHAATRVAVELLTPQREARLLYELARSRLERVALAHPVCGIALIAKDLPTLRPQHQDLFERKRAEALDWPELAERLRAHLGDEAVRQIASVADHRPERAWQFASGNRGAGFPPLPPARETAPARAKMTREAAKILSPLPPAGEAAPQARVRVAHEAAAAEATPHQPAAISSRPLWLLHRAIPLRGPAPRILAGPERIESGWWDGDDVRRDYYVVQTREGQRAWAFLAAGASDGWMLHGWFA